MREKKHEVSGRAVLIDDHRPSLRATKVSHMSIFVAHPNPSLQCHSSPILQTSGAPILLSATTLSTRRQVLHIVHD